MRWKVGWYEPKSSGIRVYYFYDSGRTTHICGLGYRVGSVHDPVAAKGVAHYIEHLLSRESMAYNGDKVGLMLWRYFGEPSDWKIETGHTSTYYGGPSLYYRKYMHNVMPMLFSLLRDRIVTGDGIKIEKGAINNEVALTEEDSPLAKLDLLLLQTMYQTNPIRNSILGTSEHLTKMNINRVKRFVKKNYVAENMFAIIFGPSKNDSMKFAEKHLTDWPYHGNPAVIDTKSFDQIPVITDPRINEFSKPGLSAYYVQLGFPTECYQSKDDAALDIISDLIWLRLMESLREKNLDPLKGTYRSPGFVDRTFIHGLVGGWFATISKDYAFYGRDQILKEFLRLREEPVTRVELMTVIDSARERFLSKFRDSPQEVADLVIESASNGDQDLKHLHSYPDRLNSVNSRKIIDVANKYFKPYGYACAMLMPA